MGSDVSALPPGVAAGHPATAQAGAAILAAGGCAADAAVAMILAGCVAETVFCGLGGGGFATSYDAATGAVTCLDFFVNVPGIDGSAAAPAREIDVRFGDVAVPYAVGGPSVAVPGVPAGAAELHRRAGRLPWPEVLAPARELATAGAPFARAHAELLPDLVDALLLGDGVAAYTRPDGALLTEGDRLFHAGLADAFGMLADDGADAFYRGPFARELVAAVRADGGALSMRDMAAYRVAELPPRAVAAGLGTLHVRGNDLDRFADTVAALDVAAVRAGGASRALALAAALQAPAARSETTTLVAVDDAGNACAVTHSLGLGSGIWVSGVHGNSMLGEGELLRGTLTPGRRMGSMMVPSVVTDHAGRLLLAGGAAGGSRIRSALLQVLVGVLIDSMPAQAAVDAPRLAAAGNTVHLEPGFAPGVVEALRASGRAVVQWPRRRPYFGGAAIADASGPAADPRRSGAAIPLP